jgi:hypothetical protein
MGERLPNFRVSAVECRGLILGLEETWGSFNFGDPTDL